MRISIDVGGTFTDVILVDESTGRFHYAKTPTTHYDLAEGVLNGLQDILNIAGASMEGLRYLIHGTTIGTNAIVEGKGAKVGLLTTEGFEDVLEIRRVARPKEAAFDFEVDNPPPLVPRYLRKGVKERINSKGGVAVPLDEGSLRAAIDTFKRERVEAIVISFLFSFLNPAHELKAAQLSREHYPEALVSLSSEICPEFREYERTCTTVMNGYLGPVIKSYMDNLLKRLNERYGAVRVHIMQSNGGSMTLETARDHSAHLINSGPAGGAMATAFISRLTRHEMAIGADMGGTTFDISIIDKGMPKTTTWGGVTEYPIKLPMVDMKTIGAGGGSIAWIDQGGMLNVGPQSSGSSPGPACYGWGGTLPTVTDANVVVGRLNPSYFLGGKIPLYPDKAREALLKHVAGPMNISLEEAALSIIRIVNANMAKGISGVSVQRGYDLREFILVPFGGAAANHAVDIAEELDIRKIVVPPMAGNFSAVGLAVADVQHDYVRTIAKKQEEVDPAELLNMFRIMEDEGVRQLREENVDEKNIRIEWSADMRYEGQSWELNTPVIKTASLGASELRDVIAAFHALHKQVYSYNEPREHVEFINLRVRAIGKNASLSLPEEPTKPTPLSEGLKEKRPIYFKEKGFVEVPIYERDRFGTGSLIPGPCLIEEQISTTLIPHGWVGEIDKFRNILITPDEQGCDKGGRS
ncbi:MAG TPA: hydantoinase/oxoprolinase family protein [Syntrophorhabdales bacterium]|nr:hydantoinase/oxoprolinase family protein [Syntrophorhabdales bacterium]